MSLMGAAGLRNVAAACNANTHALVDALCALPGISRAFDTPYFHEAVVLLDRPVGPFLAALSRQGILGGYDLSVDYPELGNALLVCATEQRSRADIDSYVTAAAEAMEAAA
jgi:glycine dehydrogenase subunit 1